MVGRTPWSTRRKIIVVLVSTLGAALLICAVGLAAYRIRPTDSNPPRPDAPVVDVTHSG